jgi:hypothetical protein
LHKKNCWPISIAARLFCFLRPRREKPEINPHQDGALPTCVCAGSPKAFFNRVPKDAAVRPHRNVRRSIARSPYMALNASKRS